MKSEDWVLAVWEHMLLFHTVELLFNLNSARKSLQIHWLCPKFLPYSLIPYIFPSPACIEDAVLLSSE